LKKDRKAVEKFMRNIIVPPHAVTKRVGTRGQALVEFALMVPLLFLLIVNAVNFGGFLYDLITVSNAARAGAQYAALGTSSVQNPPEATFTQVQTLVQNETSSLANASGSNPSVSVCMNNNGTATVLSSSPATACSTAPQDPEVAVGTTTFTSVAVDVTYTYSPFIPLFDFPNLGIHATIPTTTIHRQAIMRVLN
jgi:Flp pilus assembly protein TadG